MRRIAMQFSLRLVLVVIAMVALVLAVLFSWPYAIVGLVFSAWIGLVEWEAMRGRPNVEAKSGKLVFQYGRATRVSGILLLIAAAAGGALWLTCIRPRMRRRLCYSVAILGFLLVPLWTLLWEVTRFSIVVSQDGLHFQSPWRPGFFVAWPEISQVYYEPAMLWFVIHSSHGQTIHVSKYIAGIAEFLRQITQRLHPSGLKEPNAGLVIFRRARELPRLGIFDKAQ